MGTPKSDLYYFGNDSQEAECIGVVMMVGHSSPSIYRVDPFDFLW